MLFKDFIKKNKYLLLILLIFSFFMLLHGRQVVTNGDIYIYAFGSKLVSDNFFPIYQNEVTNEFKDYFINRGFFTSLRDSEKFVLWFQIGYMWLLAVFKLFLGDFAFSFTTPFFGALTLILTYKIGKYCFGKRTGLLASFILLFNFSFIPNNFWSMSDIPLTFFVLFSFYSMLLFLKNKKIFYIVLSGVSFSFALLFKYYVFYFGLVFLLLLYYNFGFSFFKKKFFFIFILSMIPFIFLNAYHNFTNFGFMKTGHSIDALNYFKGSGKKIMSLEYFFKGFFNLSFVLFFSFGLLFYLSFFYACYNLFKEKNYEVLFSLLFSIIPLILFLSCFNKHGLWDVSFFDYWVFIQFVRRLMSIIPFIAILSAKGFIDFLKKFNLFFGKCVFLTVVLLFIIKVPSYLVLIKHNHNYYSNYYNLISLLNNVKRESIVLLPSGFGRVAEQVLFYSESIPLKSSILENKTFMNEFKTYNRRVYYVIDSPIVNDTIKEYSFNYVSNTSFFDQQLILYEVGI